LKFASCGAGGGAERGGGSWTAQLGAFHPCVASQPLGPFRHVKLTANSGMGNLFSLAMLAQPKHKILKDPQWHGEHVFEAAKFWHGSPKWPHDGGHVLYVGSLCM
jgi:hypothetical protein